MQQASRRFTERFFRHLSPGCPIQTRAIYIHQGFPGEAFSSPVVSNTLRADLFQMFPTQRSTAATPSLEQAYADVERATEYGRDTYTHYILRSCRSPGRAFLAATSPIAGTSKRMLVSFERVDVEIRSEVDVSAPRSAKGRRIISIRVEAPRWIFQQFLCAACSRRRKRSSGRTRNPFCAGLLRRIL
jgi:hypothetical protein